MGSLSIGIKVSGYFWILDVAISQKNDSLFQGSSARLVLPAILDERRTWQEKPIYVCGLRFYK